LCSPCPLWLPRFRISYFELTPIPLDSGTVDENHKRKSLLDSHLRRSHPLIKPLISGAVDEMQGKDNKSEFWRPYEVAPPLFGQRDTG
jgi:hypothetical protein